MGLDGYITSKGQSQDQVDTRINTLVSQKNKIINGDFRIAQEGTAITITPATAAYALDQMVVTTAVANTTVTQTAFTAGQTDVAGEPEFYAAISGAAGATGIKATFRVEDVRTFAGQACTLSYYAKTVGTTYVATPAIAQNFGTGGSVTVTTPAGATQTYTNTWQKFEVTFTLPSITGKTIGANSFIEAVIVDAATSASDIHLANVQLERGSVATPFEKRDIATETALCQYYYWRWQPNATDKFITSMTGISTTVSHGVISLPTTMRIKPTCTVSAAADFYITNGVANLACSSVSIDYAGLSTDSRLSIEGVTAAFAAGGGDARLLRANSANVWFEADARL